MKKALNFARQTAFHALFQAERHHSHDVRKAVEERGSHYMLAFVRFFLCADDGPVARNDNPDGKHPEKRANTAKQGREDQHSGEGDGQARNRIDVSKTAIEELAQGFVGFANAVDG